MAITLGTPFVSGKDSLNNEFSFDNDRGERETISIPPSLLISAMGQIADVSKSITMDAKAPGNIVFLVGSTKDELGGSHLSLVRKLEGGRVPTVDSIVAKSTFAQVHRAIDAGLVRSCHDLSEGGLAVAAAEMAMAGGFGMRIDLSGMPGEDLSSTQRLFSESNTRFLVETSPESASEFEALLAQGNVPVCRLGTIEADFQLVATAGADVVLDVSLQDAKAAWKQPLDWS